jgi:4-amino-4-deoxychorismate lyase
MLDLPEPDLDAWRAAVAVGVARWVADHPDNGVEGVLRLVYSRGREGGGPPTAFATIGALAERVAGARRDGVAAITLDRGLPVQASEMPWLAAGAKTLSYAVNMAALRHAERHGAGDVIFVSSDGFLLEGPRSTVVIATPGDDGQPLLLTPPPWYPILRGTTQQALFETARNKGIDCDYRALRPADIVAAQGVWLISSVTLAARVHTLDGAPLRAATHAPDVAGLVDAAIVSDR